jgi:hypothetical protein
MRIAVLTGDIVGSTRLEAAALDEVIAALSRAADEVGTWQEADARFTRSRGDGWQVRLIRPVLALRSALFLRASLRASATGAETRIAIAEGESREDPPDDLNAATGPVYTASGRALDALAGASMVHSAGGAIGAAVRLADEISRRWTASQARSVALALAPEPPTHAAAGAILGITRQAVDQALNAAALPAILSALRLIESQAKPLSSDEGNPEGLPR